MASFPPCPTVLPHAGTKTESPIKALETAGPLPDTGQRKLWKIPGAALPDGGATPGLLKDLRDRETAADLSRLWENWEPVWQGFGKIRGWHLLAYPPPYRPAARRDKGGKTNKSAGDGRPSAGHRAAKALENSRRRSAGRWSDAGRLLKDLRDRETAAGLSGFGKIGSWSGKASENSRAGSYRHTPPLCRITGYWGRRENQEKLWNR